MEKANLTFSVFVTRMPALYGRTSTYPICKSIPPVFTVRVLKAISNFVIASPNSGCFSRPRACRVEPSTDDEHLQHAALVEMHVIHRLHAVLARQLGSPQYRKPNPMGNRSQSACRPL